YHPLLILVHIHIDKAVPRSLTLYTTTYSIYTTHFHLRNILYLHNSCTCTHTSHHSHAQHTINNIMDAFMLACWYNRLNDNQRAFEFYQKAADQGHPVAQCYVGVCYSEGEFVEKDDQRAIELY